MVSKKAAGLVAKKGYINVRWFRDGIPAWVKAGYPLDKKDALPKTKVPTINARKLNDIVGDVTIVDIRPASLHEMGSIKGSYKIPTGRLSQRYAEIPKDKPVVISDHMGKQALVAARFLKSKGYENVQGLQGGIMAWVGQGYPVEK